MNKFKTTMLIILLMNANSSLIAMEVKYKNISEYFPDYTLIDKNFLQEIAGKAPNNFEHCGDIQRWHVIRWDHWLSNIEVESIDDDVKINPAPHKFAHSINQSTFSYDAKVDSRNTLNEQQLLDVVEKNIKDGRPVMAYFQNNVNILLTTIVGFNPKTKTLLLINNGGHNDERFAEIKISVFITKMDLGPLFSTFNEEHGNLGVLCGDKSAWLPFTFIVFKKTQKEQQKEMWLDGRKKKSHAAWFWWLAMWI